MHLNGTRYGAVHKRPAVPPGVVHAYLKRARSYVPLTCNRVSFFAPKFGMDSAALDALLEPAGTVRDIKCIEVVPRAAPEGFLDAGGGGGELGGSLIRAVAVARPRQGQAKPG